MFALTLIALTSLSLALASPVMITPPFGIPKILDPNVKSYLRISQHHLLGAKPAYIATAITESGHLEVTTDIKQALAVRFVHAPESTRYGGTPVYQITTYGNERAPYVVVDEQYGLLLGSSSPVNSPPTLGWTSSDCEKKTESSVWSLNPITKLLQAKFTLYGGSVQMGLCTTPVIAAEGGSTIRMTPLVEGKHDCGVGSFGLRIETPISQGDLYGFLP